MNQESRDERFYCFVDLKKKREEVGCGKNGVLASDWVALSERTDCGVVALRRLI